MKEALNSAIPGPAKSGVKHALSAAKSLDQFAKDSEKALKEGKDLNLFQDAMAGVKFFGKAGTVLGIVNMGLTIIGEFSGEKSTDEKILSGVNEIIGRVKTLSADVHRDFEFLRTENDVQTGKLELQAQMINLEAVITYLEQIDARRKAGEPTDTLEDDLISQSPIDFVKVVDQIRDSTADSDNPLAPNILDSIYKWSFGDIRQVIPMAEYLLNQASLSVILHLVVEQIQYTRGTPTQRQDKPDPEQIASLYESSIKTISDSVVAIAEKCFSEVERKTNIENYIGAMKSSFMNILVDDYQGTADRVVAFLENGYPYLNFSAVAYENMRGWKRHAVAGENFLFLKSYPDVAGRPLNLFVYWAVRTKTNHQPLFTFKEACDNNRAPEYLLGRTITLGPSVEYKSARYDYVYDLSWRVNEQLNHGTFYGAWGHVSKDLQPFTKEFNAETDSSKRVPKSAVWIAWFDDYWDHVDPFDDDFKMGFASCNAVCGIGIYYMTICFWPD